MVIDEIDDLAMFDGKVGEDLAQQPAAVNFLDSGFGVVGRVLV
jgi:hypothetical protein